MNASSNKIKLKGNVEIITNKGQALWSKNVTIDKLKDIIKLNDPTHLILPPNHIFMDSGDIAKNFSTGSLDDVHIVLPDQSHFLAEKVDFKNDESSCLTQGIYSPCQPYIESPDKPLTWKLEAKKIKWDLKEKTIYYYNTWLKFFDIPVFYIPYFYHPDPSVPAHSGLLLPYFKKNSIFGFLVYIPYYIYQPHQSFIITPALGTKNQLLDIKLNKKTEKHHIKTTAICASANKNNDNKNWYIYFKDYCAISANNRLIVEHENTGNQTFAKLPSFNMRATNILSTNIKFEQFKPFFYFSFNSYYIKSLEEGHSSSDVPPLLPFVEIEKFYPLESDKGSFSLYSFISHLNKKNDAPKTTGYCNLAYNTNFFPHKNINTEIELGISNIYRKYISILQKKNKNQILSYPYINIKSSLITFVNRTTNIEPFVQAFITPRYKQRASIPQDDSWTNPPYYLHPYTRKRNFGMDQWDQSSKVFAGADFTFHNNKQMPSSLLIGQNYYFYNFNNSSTKGKSPYYLTFKSQPHPNFTIDSSVELNPENFSMERSLTTLEIKINRLSLYPEYQIMNLDNKTIKQGSLSSTFQLNNNWKLYANINRQFSRPQKTLKQELSFVYENECLISHFGFRRHSYVDRDIKPSNEIYIQFILKNLADFNSTLGLRH